MVLRQIIMSDSSKKIMTKIGVGSQASSVLDNVSYSNGCYGKILKNDGSERGRHSSYW